MNSVGLNTELQKLQSKFDIQKERNFDFQLQNTIILKSVVINLMDDNNKFHMILSFL